MMGVLAGAMLLLLLLQLQKTNKSRRYNTSTTYDSTTARCSRSNQSNGCSLDGGGDGCETASFEIWHETNAW